MCLNIHFEKFKKCPECGFNYFLEENNYTICFKCGLIIESKNLVNYFKPSGFKIEEKNNKNNNVV